ncbi:MAG: TenA family protein [Reyranellaceae bacterium]
MSGAMAKAAELSAFEAGFFGRLRQAALDPWLAYVEHDFVRRLAEGSLPEASFRHYLVQDYLFLIQFARAWALAGYKASSLEELRAAGAAMAGIVDVEMGLHVRYCAGWGLDEAAMAGTPEAAATLAYTRFVLERGMAGDLLDLQVALAPCIVGYAEIGRRLQAWPGRRRAGNRYDAWIEMYAGAAYQEVARDAMAALERSAQRRGGQARFADLAASFAIATRLEARFWQMGLELGE